jgi:hypothetical protein
MVCSAGMDENFVRERMGIDKPPAKVCCAPARSELPSDPTPAAILQRGWRLQGG